MAVEIPRYLADPEQSVTLRNGASVRVRAIRPDDEPRLMALCRRLSPRTVYQRFFSVRRLVPEEAHAFANVDYRQRMAVVAEVDDGPEPELVGVARYGPSDEGTADIGRLSRRNTIVSCPPSPPQSQGLTTIKTR